MTARLKSFRTPGVKPYHHLALEVRDMTSPERECWMILNNGREVARAALVEGSFLLGTFDASGNFLKLLEKSGLPGVKNHFKDTGIAVQCLEEGVEAVKAFLHKTRDAQVANDDCEPSLAPSPAPA